MIANHMSSHRRMALLERFAPAEIIEDSARPDRGPGRPAEGRIHLWGELDGAPVDVLVRWGGMFTEPSVTAASLEAVGSESHSPEAIATAARKVLAATS